MAKEAGELNEIILAYSHMIRHYLDMGNFGKAHEYIDEVRGMTEDKKTRESDPV